MENPTLSKIVQKNIITLVLTPMLVFALLLAVYIFFISTSDIEKANLSHSKTIGQYIDNYINTASSVLRHLSIIVDNNGLETASWELKNTSKSFPFFDRLILIDQNGIVFKSEPEGSKGNIYPIRNTDFEQKKYIISKPIISPATGHLVVYIDHLAKGNQRIIGELSLDYLQTFVYNTLPPESGKIILTDTYGNVIVHPDISNVRHQVNLGHEEMFLAYKKDNDQSFLFQNQDGYFLGSVQKLPKSNWLLFLYKPLFNILKPLLITSMVILVGFIMLSYALIALLQRKMRRNVISPFQLFTNHIEKTKDNPVPFNELSNKFFFELSVMNNKFSELIEKINHREKDLTKSEEKYRTIFENSVEGIFRSSVKGQFMYVNPAMTQMFGYDSSEDLISTIDNISEKLYVNPLKREDYLTQLKNNGRVYGFEVEMLKKNGSKIWVSISSWAVMEEGHFSYIEGIIEDITRRRLAEQKLKWEKELTEKTINSLKDIYFVFDIKTGKAIRWNNAFRVLSEYTDEEISNLKALDSYFDVKELQKVNILIHSLAKGNNDTVELFLKTKTDKRILIEYTASFIESDEDERQLIVAIGRDITERKQAEEELKRAQIYISNIIDSMPSMLIGVDSQGIITQWNKTAEQVTQISSTDAKGSELKNIFPRLAAEIDEINSSIKSNEIKNIRKMLPLTEHNSQYQDITIYPLTSENIEGAVIRIDDVTDKVRMEEMIIQSEKMLSVGRLAAGMAHEINNPLGGILQSVQNIQRRLSRYMESNVKIAKELGTDLKNINNYLEKRDILTFIQGIRDAGLRASTIVSNMLQFSRQSDVRMNYVDIHKLINQVLDIAANDYDLMKKYDFRHILILKYYANDLPQIKMIKTEIEQVFFNLFKNAAQAMRESHTSNPKLIIRTQLLSDSISITVEDNGPGMSEEVRKKAFEPFFTTKDVGSGTGLGLAVCYMIITNNHKGTIILESQLDKGTQFIINIPIIID